MSDSEAKRTEYQRSQMSLGERVEVLERAVDRLRANKATLDWAEGIDRAMANLLGRVAEIDKGHTETMLGHFHGNHARADLEAAYNARADRSGKAKCEMVECSELARLRRVEQAARQVLKNCVENGYGEWSDWEGHIELGAALDSEPKR